MKLAVTSKGKALESAVDRRFGRAKFFIVADTETGFLHCVDNDQSLNALQGAGIQAANNVVELDVQAVVTGHIGPKAFAVLKAGGIPVYTGATGTVAEAVEQFKENQLELAGEADVEGHWV